MRLVFEKNSFLPCQLYFDNLRVYVFCESAFFLPPPSHLVSVRILRFGKKDKQIAQGMGLNAHDRNNPRRLPRTNRKRHTEISLVTMEERVHPIPSRTR